MALYKKSSVEIPPVDRTKTTKKRDTIKVVKIKKISQREIGEPSFESNSQNTPSESFSLSPTQKIGLVGAGLLGITAGGSVYNYKTLNDYQNAMKKIDPSFKGDTKKAKIFNAIKDATKTTFTGRTKIPFGEGVILKKPIYTFGNNLMKTLILGGNSIENLKSKKSINPIKIEKPINVEQPTVTPKKAYVKNTNQLLLEEGNPIKMIEPPKKVLEPYVIPKNRRLNPPITQSNDVRFVTEIIDGVPQTRSVLPGESPNYVSTTDGIVKPNNGSMKKGTGTSGNLYSGFNPDSKATKDALKLFKKVGYGLLNNAGAIGTAGAYMMNEQESVDKYGVGAKAVVDNIINTSVDMVNPLNYLRMASSPTNLIAKYGGDNIISNTAKKVSGVYDTVINTAENSVYNNFNKRMQEENNSRNISEDKKLYNKMKSTPDYTVSDIQKAVMYGDTKRSGLEALETISASTGIPTDKLLSEGRKIWSKRKK